jgi:hypothetical protein
MSVATCGSSSYQKWEVLDSNVYFSPIVTGLTSPCSAKCLDVVGGTGNEVRITQQECDPARLPQYWIQTPPVVLPLPGETWFKNFATGRCMTSEGGGSYVDQYDCSNGARHQIWTVGTDVPAAGGAPITNAASLNLNCLGVKGGSPLNGAETNANVLCDSGAFGQHFQMTNSTPNVFKNRGSTKCLDGGGSAAPTYQYTCSVTAKNHQWLSFTYPSEGIQSYAYYLDLLSGLCLTYDPNNFANVHTETCVKGNANQQWLSLWTL